MTVRCPERDPAARTRTRSCPGPGCSIGNSTTWRTSGPPFFVNITARYVAPIHVPFYLCPQTQVSNRLQIRYFAHASSSSLHAIVEVHSFPSPWQPLHRLPLGVPSRAGQRGRDLSAFANWPQGPGCPCQSGLCLSPDCTDRHCPLYSFRFEVHINGQTLSFVFPTRFDGQRCFSERAGVPMPAAPAR